MWAMKLAELIRKYEEMFGRSPAQVQDCMNSYKAELARSVEGIEDEILDALNRLRESKDWHSAMLLLVAAETRMSERYRSVLCDLLSLKDPLFPNEYAVEVLTPLVNDSCLPVLQELVHHRFNSDPDRQIAIKAMNAISDIGGPPAIALLQQLHGSDDPRLSEEAGYLLDGD